MMLLNENQTSMRIRCLINSNTWQCCKAFYIGKTEGKFGERFIEHTGVSAPSSKPFSNRPKSDILDHCQKCHTDGRSENFITDDNYYGKYELEKSESLHQRS